MRTVFATGNQLFISPSKSQMNVGTQFCVQISSYADTDETSGTAVGDVTYPSSKLQVVSISTADTDCSGHSVSGYDSTNISQPSGKLSFNATRSPAPGGIVQVFKIKFKAIKGGAAAVGFSTSSLVNNATTSYKNASFTIIDPNPSRSPSPSPSHTTVPVTSKDNSNNNTSGDTKVQPTPDATGLIDNSSVYIDVSYTAGTITWKTTNGKAASFKVSYGSSDTNLDKQAKVASNEDGSYTASVDGLEPGTQYYFTITGKDSKGKSGSYSDAIFTVGYPVAFTITENNLPAKNAVVRIGTLTRTGDQSGAVTIGLAAGDYSGSITTDTATLNINFTVAKKSIPSDGSDPQAQPLKYDLKSSAAAQAPGSGFSVLTFIGILMIGAVVLGIAFFGYVAYRRRHFDTDDTVIHRGPSVVVDDGFDWSKKRPGPLQESDTPPDATTPNPFVKQTHERPRHDNSVYINDSEPTDMFDRKNASVERFGRSEDIEADVPEEPVEPDAPADSTESTDSDDAVDENDLSISHRS